MIHCATGENRGQSTSPGLDFPTALFYRHSVDWLISLDHSLLLWVNSTFTHPWMDAFFPAITDLHKTWYFRWLVPLLVLLLTWNAYRWRAFLVLIGAVVCLGVVDGFTSQVMKKTVQRPRPFQTQGLQVIQRSPAGSHSFPSNHAANTFAIATFLTFFVRSLGPFLFAIAFLVSYSRVYNGVHFPLDVITGALIGYFFGSVMARLLVRILIHKPRQGET